ncbi:MAG: hypothetical protein JO368_03130 [Acidimicrobiales bacterium]|nr:hypothetical protein [Acidimicrobiales bacterium]
MTKQYGSADGTSERGQIRQNVVYRGDEPVVDDVRDSNEDTTGKGHREEDAHHKRSFPELQQDQTPRHDRDAGGRPETVGLPARTCRQGS